MRRRGNSRPKAQGEGSVGHGGNPRRPPWTTIGGFRWGDAAEPGVDWAADPHKPSSQAHWFLPRPGPPCDGPLPPPTPPGELATRFKFQCHDIGPATAGSQTRGNWVCLPLTSSLSRSKGMLPSRMTALAPRISRYQPLISLHQRVVDTDIPCANALESGYPRIQAH